MTFNVRFTEEAQEDLVRLYEFPLDRNDTDGAVAEHSLEAIKQAIRSLENSPFSFRKVDAANPFLRELVIPFGASGYVALCEIDNDHSVTILAVRHQREDDYH
ncbi:MAG: type II toxin-antitoxin system RelE/ParE family toxin [Rhodocyclaceae bacterium]|jgi:plasmid stabilization system protein ParE|nr:type II toxin-antitoxin system RelE/ParE family toxin [Rhodocyclaceae bacterium]MBK6908463.1 type II toxin-antitoxin system RelE/ParE family toxin [Rhodocyclaceae bacterium]